MAARHCPFCAEEVKAEAIICRYCQRPITPGTCLECGKRNRAEARHCGWCGSAKLIWPAAGRPAAPEPRRDEAPKPAPAEAPAPAPAPAAEPARAPVQGAPAAAAPGGISRSAVIGALVVLAGLGYALWSRPGRPPEPPAVQAPEAPAAQAPAAAGTAAPAGRPAAAPSVEEPPKPAASAPTGDRSRRGQNASSRRVAFSDAGLPGMAASGPEPSAEQLDAAAGQWGRTNDMAGAEPPSFRHYFVMLGKDSQYIARGAIMRGFLWDKSRSPKFKVVYGHTQGSGEWFADVGGVAYLGPVWNPSWAALSDSLYTGYASSAKASNTAFIGKPGSSPAPAAPAPASIPAFRPAAAAPAAFSVEQVEREKGEWVARFSINMAGEEPSVFRHYFVQLSKLSRYVARGAIMRGFLWDKSSSPKFKVVYGHTQGSGQWFCTASEVAYLGPDWDPSFAALSDALYDGYDDPTKGENNNFIRP